jgi:hypothetical protein
MLTRVKSLFLVFLIGAMVAPRLHSQNVPSTRSSRARRPVAVIVSPTQVSRIRFSGSASVVDSIFIRDSPGSVALLESAIGLLSAQRVRDAGMVDPTAGARRPDLLLSSARKSWLPGGDRARLASFIARVKDSGVQCRSGAINSRDRCLSLSLMDGTSLVKYLASNNVTPPDR